MKPKSSGKPTIHDVVRESGKSLGTISRVINQHPSVTPATRLAVEQAIAKLGYTPNSVAASLRSNVTMVIGLIVTDIANPLFAEITKGAESVLRGAGYSLVIGATDGNTDNEIALIELMKKRKVDGLLLSINDETSEKLLAEIANLDMPIGLLDRRIPIPHDSVMADHHGGVAKAVAYLSDLGHTRIALISADDTISPGRSRLAGYCEALEACDIVPDEALIRLGRLDAEFGFQEAIDLIAMEDRPTAIISGGNQILPGVLRAIKQAQLSIPKDMSLISCDDTPLSELHVPPITVVQRDTALLGMRSAELLMARIEDLSRTEQHQVLGTELLVRGSCTRPPAAQRA